MCTVPNRVKLIGLQVPASELEVVSAADQEACFLVVVQAKDFRVEAAAVS